MRRLAAPAAAAVLALSMTTVLTACGGDSEGAADATGTPSNLTVSASPTEEARVRGGKDDIGGSVSANLRAEPKIVLPKKSAPSRLLTEDIVVGDGEVAGPTSTVTVRYVAMFYDSGETFDSSWDREAKKDTFSLTGVVVGFARGVAGMRVGGRRQIVVPPPLAYGEQGHDDVPPDQTLVFVVDLLDVP